MAEAGSAGLAGGPSKLIAASRPTLEVQVAAASWGRMLKQPTLNPTELLIFIRDFRNKAPEAGAA